MIHRVLIDTAEVPNGKELKLYQHDKDYAILSGTEELMSSRMHESEEALARLAIESLGKRKKVDAFIGGLGMGWTLRASLDALPDAAKVVVAELVPAVIKWNQGVLSELAGHPLKDPRVEVVEADAAKLIKKSKMAYDVILLDVDNGPSGLTSKSNNWFYGMTGIYAARTALRPQGVLGIWSAARDEQFTCRLEKVGFTVKETRARSRPGKKGQHHHIWIATRK